MANKKKGNLTTSGEWAKHLRGYLKRQFWKGERIASKKFINSEVGQMSILDSAFSLLPSDIQNLAILRGNEYGWIRENFIDVVSKAVENELAIIGGQVQVFVDGATIELYWRSYDPEPRRDFELWHNYIKRTKEECLYKFYKIPPNESLIAEVAENVKDLPHDFSIKATVNFILYFEVEHGDASF